MGLSLFFPHPNDTWQKAHDAANEIVGDVTVEYEPHVTLLYMGDVRQGVKIPDVKKAIVEALDGIKPVKMKSEGISFFPPTKNSEGRTPIIIKYDASEHLEALSTRMLRALAPFVHAKQFLDYSPHSTLGYFEGILSTGQKLELTKISEGSEEWVAHEIVFAEGTRVHQRFTLTGVAKSELGGIDVSPVEDNDSDISWSCKFVSKSEDDKQIVTGIVLEPDEVDLQNDTISPEEIESAAHRFLARYNRLTKMGLMHQMFGNIGVELIESWIAREDITMNGEPVKKGSWLMSVHVTSKALWRKVKDGSITGFSIGGTAKVT